MATKTGQGKRAQRLARAERVAQMRREQQSLCEADDVLRLRAEEVQVARWAFDEAVCEHRSSAGQGRLARFRERQRQPREPLLYGIQAHRTGAGLRRGSQA